MPSFHLPRYFTPYHQGQSQMLGNTWEVGASVGQSIFPASSEASSL